jgi:hypothetical protein
MCETHDTKGNEQYLKYDAQGNDAFATRVIQDNRATWLRAALWKCCPLCSGMLLQKVDWVSAGVQ